MRRSARGAPESWRVTRPVAHEGGASPLAAAGQGPAPRRRACFPHCHPVIRHGRAALALPPRHLEEGTTEDLLQPLDRAALVQADGDLLRQGSRPAPDLIV